ncbi:MAG: hypothetical protein DHS20C15_07370 [Planctomycetota bacterium]|nr:MAG: hypothetical protein DHS20C15_07370 [Planctomycetota bacterium]
MSSSRKPRRRKESNVGLLVTLLVVLLGVVGGAAFLLLDSQSDGTQGGPTAALGVDEQPEAPTGTLPEVLVNEAKPTQLAGPITSRPAPSVEAVPANTPLSALQGRVVTPQNQPLPGAQLSIYRGNPMLTGSFLGSRKGVDVSAVSDAEGKFRLEGVPIGKNYVVVAEHPDYATTEVRNQTLRRNKEITGILVRMESGASICGRVLDLGEGPIAQARVEFYDAIQSAQQLPEERRPWKVVLTDGSGAFCFEHVSTAAYRLRAVAPGFETQSRSYSAAFEGKLKDQTVVFYLDIGRDMIGTVVDQSGQPIPQVFLEAVAMTKDYQATVTSTSAPDGTFILEGMGDSPYTLRATANGYSRLSLSNVSVNDGELLLEMQRQIGVEGWVRTAKGESVRKFRVALMRAHPGRDPMLMNDLRMFNDSEGHFVFDRLDPGSYALQVRAEGFAIGQSESFTVHREEETPPLEIALLRGGTLRGTVTDPEGEPVRGALVELHENEYVDLYINEIFGDAMGSVELKIQTRTNAAGEYVLEHLTPDTYQVRASHLESPPAIVNHVVVLDDDVGSNRPLELQLPRGASISGRAVYESGSAMAFSTVQVNRGTEFNEVVSTDESGYFLVEHLLEGNYDLRLQPDKDEAGKPLNPLISMVYAQRTQQTHFVRAGQALSGVVIVAPRMQQN